MRKIILCHLVLTSAMAHSQWSYTLSKVPGTVKEKAAIVTHFENIDYTIESLDKASYKVHKVYTVLNEEGKNGLFFNEFSNRAIVLDDAEVKVFDSEGKQLGRYRKKDMSTVAVGEGLVEDGYVTYYPIPVSSYPVTIETKYELKLKNTLTIPTYRFINPKEGVVESNFTANVPADVPVRYKAQHASIEPVVTENGSVKTYKWSVRNLSPVENEEGAVTPGSRFPRVELVANRFSYYGVRGDFSTWKTFGIWIKALYEGMDELPPERQQFYANMVSGIPNTREKIRKIYSYMQENFRYVSIQLGIGGLKPFSATFTDNKKYGDCKALSNFMKAALKAAGIRSHLAVINASHDELPVDPSFPSNSSFNHVILCVPNTGDTTWLECTSSTAEFGELGTFTENRFALLITEDGGVLASTPASLSSSNVLSSKSIVSIATDLTGSVRTSFISKGAYRDILADALKDKRDEQKDFIINYLGFKQPDLFELAKDNTDAYKTHLKMELSKVWEFAAGNKIFIPSRAQKTWSSKLPKAENRKLDFYFKFPFEKFDTTVYKLPADLSLETLPAAKSLDCGYATYQTRYSYSEADRSIYSVTTLTLKKHKIVAADYAAVRKFFDEILQDHTQKLVLKKTEAVEKKAF
jgi:hypothetical protein